MWLILLLLPLLKYGHVTGKVESNHMHATSNKWNPNWKSVVILGDSTAGKFSDALAGVLSCLKVHTEEDISGRVPDKFYFSRNGKNYDRNIV